MKARILLVVGSLVLGACKEPPVLSQRPASTTPSSVSRPVYLLRRVAVATTDSLYGLDAGTQLKVIEERPGRLLVETQGVQFEIDQRDATNDSDKANMLLARAEEEKTVRQVAMATRLRIEDRKFLAEENIRRLSAAGMQVAHLRRAVDSARAEIASLEAAQSAPTGYRRLNTTSDETSSSASLEDDARQQRISFLRTYIADCDREIQMLSDAMARWE
ncbi:MAG: hypothetical protein WBL39_05040 [Terrimicrobiaceae bacterium]